MSFTVEHFKAQFPLFQQPENKQLVYLDNAATTQKPEVVINAIRDFYLHCNANTHRSSHRLARRATEMVEQVRTASATFLNTASSREVIFTRGATEALNLLACSLCSRLRAGDEIVLSTAEHHANLVPWQMMAERYELQLRFVPDAAGIPQFDRLPEVVSERTRVVSLTGGSNALGLRPDLATIAGFLRGRDLFWIVDAAQLAAHESIDVQAIGCDFLVCSAHKFYGPTGVGLLYGREALLREMPPWQGGGEMITHVELHSSEYADLPHKFEAGTSSLAAIAALGAAIRFLADSDRAAMAAHEQQLIQIAHQQLSELPEIRLFSKSEDNLGVVAFSLPQHSATDLMHWLDGQDIAVRVGHHCAQPLAKAMGQAGTVRVSIAAYNTKADIDKLIAAVRSFLVEASASSAKEPSRERADIENWIADDLTALNISQLSDKKNWQDRYRELLSWGKHISEKPEIRRRENLVRGCESSAWLVCRQDNNKLIFALDSDSRVVKGLGALLLSQLSGKSKAEICSLELSAVFTELGLDKHLSQSRSNGFYALLRQILLLVESA